MKTLNSVLLIILVFSSFDVLGKEPATSAKCESYKSQMASLCKDYMAETCEYFVDCFKRRDSCGKGTKPKTSGECSELNECHKSLMQQYPSNFSENTLCEYKWIVDEKDASSSWCRMRQGHNGINAVCPGDIRPGGFLLNWLIKDVSASDAINSSVDDFNCVSLIKYYQSKLTRCENIRADFKEEGCLKSPEDREAYVNSKPESCKYYKNFNDYPFGSKKLDVRMKSVNDGSRRGKPTDDSSSSNQSSSGGVVNE